MKKFLAIILSAIMLLSVSACSFDNKKETGNSEQAVSNTTELITEVEVTTDLSEQIVTFTFPKMGEENYSNELTEDQIESGFLSVVVNEDGSATYTMKRRDWLLMLEELRTTAFDSFLNTSEKGYDSIYSYEIGEEFDYVTFYVDYDKYISSSDAFAALGVTVTMSLVQSAYGIAVDNIGFKFNLADYQTKEIVETFNLPEDLNS